jgi:hypothetical protein
MRVMKIVESKRMGSVTVFEDTLLLGEVVGDVILNSGHLELKGKVLGNLYVRKGTCRVLGIVRGNLENEKGDVEVFGAGPACDRGDEAVCQAYFQYLPFCL